MSTTPQTMHISLCIISIALLGSSCAMDGQTYSATSERPAIVSPSVTTVSVGGTWKELENGISYMAYAFEENSFAQIYLYKIDPRVVQLRFVHNEKNPQTLTAWARQFSDALIVFNGVYFSDDFFPSGYVAVDGKHVGTRAFPSESSGYITFDDEIAVIDGSVDSSSLYNAQNSAQNHPLLISAGVNVIKSDDGKKAWRTFIGQDTGGFLYIGVVPRKMITLFELMTILQNMEIAWDTVLNLDGGSSTGLAATIGDHTNHFNSYDALPHVFVVEAK